VSDTLQIATQKETYEFNSQATPQGLLLPIDTYKAK